MRFGFLLLILPVCLAVAADQTHDLPYKMGVPLSCALVLFIYLGRRVIRRRDVWFVIGAFVFSAIGDYFLSNKRDNDPYFVIGIAGYFVAHLGYLGFCLLNGKLDRGALAVLCAGYLPYYALALYPAVDQPALSVAVLLYLIVSCVVVAAARGLRLSPVAKWLYVFGILMILVSDTIISFHEFLEYNAFNDWIHPTYYMAHLAVTASVIATSGEREKKSAAAEA